MSPLHASRARIEFLSKGHTTKAFLRLHRQTFPFAGLQKNDWSAKSTPETLCGHWLALWGFADDVYAATLTPETKLAVV